MMDVLPGWRSNSKRWVRDKRKPRKKRAEKRQLI